MNEHEQLRQELEETRLAFHQLLAKVPDEAFDLPSDNPAWTIGQTLYHMSVAPRLVIADAKMIAGQSWLVRLAIRLVPEPLFHWLNERLTRLGARHLSRRFLADVYDQAHKTALRALESVAEEDFQKSFPYPDWDPMLSGDVTLEKLFHYIKGHFDSHADQVERLIAGPDSEMAD